MSGDLMPFLSDSLVLVPVHAQLTRCRHHTHAAKLTRLPDGVECCCISRSHTCLSCTVNRILPRYLLFTVGLLRSSEVSQITVTTPLFEIITVCPLLKQLPTCTQFLYDMQNERRKIVTCFVYN